MTSEDLKERVRERDDYTCQMCDTHEDDTADGIVVHHIVPKSEGGQDYIENLVVLCRSCHYGNFNYWHTPPFGEGKLETSVENMEKRNDELTQYDSRDDVSTVKIEDSVKDGLDEIKDGFKYTNPSYSESIHFLLDYFNGEVDVEKSDLPTPSGESTDASFRGDEDDESGNNRETAEEKVNRIKVDD